MKKMSTCFDVFEQCVIAIKEAELTESVSARDFTFKTGSKNDW